jgi:hypothetical protein
MPAFTFEKISPPNPHNNGTPGSTQSSANMPPANKPPGVMVQIFSRLVETRVDRTQRVDQAIAARRERDPK